MQWKRPEKRALVKEALKEAGREDLIGYGKECLLRPDRPAWNGKPGVPAKGKAQGRSGRPPKREEEKLKQKAGGWSTTTPSPSGRRAGQAQAQEERQARQGRK